MKKLIVSICLAVVGCFPWQFYEHEPFTPTTDNSDLEFVRTGDREYYYVIDRKRKLCFFHSRLYGHAHMTRIPCDHLPEYSASKKTMRSQAPVPAAETKQERAAGKQAAAQSKQKPEVTATPSREIPPLTTKERNGFKRAYIQYYCVRKTGKSDDLDAILSRHGITRERYEVGKAEFSRDKDLWVALSKEATEACK